MNYFWGGTESITHKSKKSILIAKNEEAKCPKKIMVAFDFSHHCDDAIKWAKDLSLKFNSEIHLINVIPCYYQGYHVAHTFSNHFNVTLDEMIEESAKKITDKLNVKAGELRAEGFNIVSNAILDKDGSVSDKLLDYEGSNDIDLLIVGSHAKGTISELFLGSVANKMIKKSKKSILIAR